MIDQQYGNCDNGQLGDWGICKKMGVAAGNGGKYIVAICAIIGVSGEPYEWRTDM